MEISETVWELLVAASGDVQAGGNYGGGILPWRAEASGFTCPKGGPVTTGIGWGVIPDVLCRCWLELSAGLEYVAVHVVRVAHAFTQRTRREGAT